MPLLDQAKPSSWPVRLPRHAWLATALLVTVPPVPPPPAAAEQADGDVQEIRLETSDGIRIAAWYYAVPKGSRPAATVILVHDLEGSHKTVERLAVPLQQAGFAVVAPDLRGHGASGVRPAGGPAAGKGDTPEHRLLKKQDLEAIASATGGRIRDQCSLRGEIEAVRHWIKQRSEAGELDIDRICVVGSGLGATLAATWTAADWNWPPTTAGPQGRQVRGLVLVSPTWAFKGISLSPALQSPAIQHEVPILVLAGKADRDALRLFDQLKKWRPNAWFQQRSEQVDKARDLGDPSTGTVFLIQVDTSLSADKLADDQTLGLADRIKTFLGLALARKRD